MKALDRLIFFIVGILLIMASIALISFAVPIYPIMEYVRTSIQNYTGSIELGIVGLIILILGLRAIWSCFKVERVEETVKHETEIGEVKISLQTIESLVLQAAKNKIKGIKEITAKIRTTESGVLILIKGKILADLEIPQVSEELQTAVKEHVESKAGITVGEVKVLIENVASDASRPSSTK